MNYIDMFVLVLLIYAVFQGFTRGFVMQLTLLAALFLSIFGALKLSGFTAQHLERFNFNPENLYLISLGVTFLFVFIVINLLGRVIEKMVEAIELSLVNRMLGILFSLCKTILIVGILLAYADRMDQRVHFLPAGTREHSLFFRPFSAIARAIFPSLGNPGSSGEVHDGEFV
jgi:membrane protein required for colicin V production